MINQDQIIINHDHLRESAFYYHIVMIILDSLFECIYALGAASNTSLLTPLAYFSKFFINSLANCFALSS